MIKAKYKISVITVVYNGVKTIERTIQSVLGQSYKNIEYIIIDGHSTDGTQQLVMKYIDSIAYFVSEKDAGIYDAMNKGIECATGDYIIFINSDDSLAENALEQGARHLCDTVDILYGDIYMVQEDGTETRMIGELKDIQDIIYRGICHQAVLASTRLLKENYFDIGYKIAADYDWLLKMYYKGVNFVYAPVVFSYYCATGYSAVNRELCSRECFKISMKCLRQSSKQIQEKYVSVIKEWYYIYLLENICEIVQDREVISRILEEIFIPKENVFMFGRGNNADICLKILSIIDINVLKIFDNNKAIWGSFYQGIEVVGVDRFIGKRIKVVVSSTNYEEEIYHQLVVKGFKDIILLSDLKKKIFQAVNIF